MKGHDLARNTNPAVARLADDLLAAIAAICAARTRERIMEAAGRLPKRRRGRPRKRMTL